ncbi:MAG: hypothetical protein KJ011_08530 [Burkholderiaceae bacterium]|nr:hypothetical protein [Burkholderiaceae bacterium]
MGFTIDRQGDELLVRIDDAAPEVYDAVCACKMQSWWSCPSGECAKIAACNTRHDSGTTFLALTPHPGETLSATGIEECLRYVLDEAARLGSGNAVPPA